MTNKSYSNLSGWEAPQGNASLHSEPPVRSSELVLRPADATHDALRKCLKWLDACRDLGWDESVMPDLESLFWTYHDSAGNKNPQNDPNLPGIPSRL